MTNLRKGTTITKYKRQTSIWLPHGMSTQLKALGKPHGRTMGEEMRVRLQHSLDTVADLEMRPTYHAIVRAP